MLIDGFWIFMLTPRLSVARNHPSFNPPNPSASTSVKTKLAMVESKLRTRSEVPLTMSVFWLIPLKVIRGPLAISIVPLLAEVSSIVTE